VLITNDPACRAYPHRPPRAAPERRHPEPPPPHRQPPRPARLFIKQICSRCGPASFGSVEGLARRSKPAGW
jgi:hypothetical protein